MKTTEQNEIKGMTTPELIAFFNILRAPCIRNVGATEHVKNVLPLVKAELNSRGLNKVMEAALRSGRRVVAA